jgi:AbiJ N-terminal domain 4
MSDTFSRRFGVRPVPTQLVRDEAPGKMRSALVALLASSSVDLLLARDCLYQVLREVMPTWMEDIPKWNFFDGALRKAAWYEVFDFIETLCSELKDYELEEKINEVFDEYGIGWKVLYGQIETRGDEIFEQSVSAAREGLKRAGRDTAASELNEAMADLSRRPKADARGAIIRSVGALEALAKDLKEEPNATLGQLIKQVGLPKPLDGAAAQLWGYASDQARHVTEGYNPKRSEAALVVHICAALISYLSEGDN